ncbi:MAG: hypothetical protein LWX56_00735 [Ignavibacteria bacterium]|nr:hypothetical protein [Ignavibacteria bacterium]
MDSKTKKLLTELLDKSDNSRQIPEMLIERLPDDFNQDNADECTLNLIETSITDKNKLREFDCLFCTQTKNDAKILRDCLRHNHKYNTRKPYFDDGEWVIGVNKLITVANLREEVKKLRKFATVHSAELIDWMMEVDTQSPLFPDDSDTASDK